MKTIADLLPYVYLMNMLAAPRGGAAVSAVKASEVIPPGFVYDARTRRYHNVQTRRFVAFRTIFDLMQANQDASAETMVNLCLALKNGDLAPATWYVAMARQLQRLHVQNAALGAGGLESLRPRDYMRMDAALRDDYERLRRFAADILAGRQSDAQIANRVQMYVGRARINFYRSRPMPYAEKGETVIERRRLGIAEHCSYCQHLADLGWQPYGVLPVPGESDPSFEGDQCLTNCRCDLEQRVVVEAEAEALMGRSAKAWRAPFDESKHRRHPKGTRLGGRFAPKYGAHAPRQAAAETADVADQGDGGFSLNLDLDTAQSLIVWLRTQMEGGKQTLDEDMLRRMMAWLQTQQEESDRPPAAAVEVDVEALRTKILDYYNEYLQASEADRAEVDRISKELATLNRRITALAEEAAKRQLEPGERLSEIDEVYRQIQQLNKAYAKAEDRVHRHYMSYLGEVDDLMRVDDPIEISWKSSLPKTMKKDIVAALFRLQPWISRAAVPEFDLRETGLRFKESDRVTSYYRQGTGQIYLCKGHGQATVIHEVGHYLEELSFNLRRQVRAFLERRTRGEDPVEYGKDHMTGPLAAALRFAEVKWTQPDRFVDPYIGLIYGEPGQRTATEVLSMGLEILVTEPHRLAAGDPDMFGFLVRLLRGDPAADRPDETATKAWGNVRFDPSKHPRHPKGTRWSPTGPGPGRFAESGAGQAVSGRDEEGEGGERGGDDGREHGWARLVDAMAGRRKPDEAVKPKPDRTRRQQYERAQQALQEGKRQQIFAERWAAGLDGPADSAAAPRRSWFDTLTSIWSGFGGQDAQWDEQYTQLMGQAAVFSNAAAGIAPIDGMDAAAAASAVSQVWEQASQVVEERQQAYAQLRASTLDALRVEQPISFKVETSGLSENQIRAVNEGVAIVSNLVDKRAFPGLEKALAQAVRFETSPDRHRSYFDQGRILLSPNAGVAQVVHELGHWLEASNPAILQMTTAFLNKRTGDELPMSLRNLMRDPSFSEKEMAQPDRFPHPYFGALYGSPDRRYSTEILSMGLEWMATRPQELAEKDPELFEFVFSLTRGGQVDPTLQNYVPAEVPQVESQGGGGRGFLAGLTGGAPIGIMAWRWINARLQSAMGGPNRWPPSLSTAGVVSSGTRELPPIPHFNVSAPRVGGGRRNLPATNYPQRQFKHVPGPRTPKPSEKDTGKPKTEKVRRVVDGAFTTDEFMSALARGVGHLQGVSPNYKFELVVKDPKKLHKNRRRLKSLLARIDRELAARYRQMIAAGLLPANTDINMRMSTDRWIELYRRYGGRLGITFRYGKRGDSQWEYSDVRWGRIVRKALDIERWDNDLPFKTWDESKIRRHPRGTRQGGRFAPKHGARQAPPLTQTLAVRRAVMDAYQAYLSEVERKIIDVEADLGMAAEAMASYPPLSPEYALWQTRWMYAVDAATAVYTEYRTAYNRFLDALRPALETETGSIEVEIDENSLTPEQVETVRWAVGVLERIVDPVWLAAIPPERRRPRVVGAEKGSVTRARYKPTTNTLHLGDVVSPMTVVHELAHWLEWGNPELRDRIFAFLDKRVGDADLLPFTGAGYGANEMYQPDRFPEPYFGKYYGEAIQEPDGRVRPHRRTASELLSMGLEWMLFRPHRLLLDDAELFDFIYTTVHRTQEQAARDESPYAQVAQTPPPTLNRKRFLST